MLSERTWRWRKGGERFERCYEVGLTGWAPESWKLVKQRQEVKFIEVSSAGGSVRGRSGQSEPRDEFILDTWTLSIHTEGSRVQAVRSALTSEDVEAAHWEEINEAVKACPETTHRDLRGLEKRLQAESWGLLMFKISKYGEEPPGGCRNGLRYKMWSFPTLISKISPQLVISSLSAF